MGIEPTQDSSEPYTGFEDQERHQTPVASRAACLLCLTSRVGTYSIGLSAQKANFSIPTDGAPAPRRLPAAPPLHPPRDKGTGVTLLSRVQSGTLSYLT